MKQEGEFKPIVAGKTRKVFYDENIWVDQQSIFEMSFFNFKKNEIFLNFVFGRNLF